MLGVKLFPSELFVISKKDAGASFFFLFLSDNHYHLLLHIEQLDCEKFVNFYKNGLTTEF